MKTIFDPATREELISRISTLNEKSTAQWGKMNVYQMLRHCILWEEMAQGKKKYKQSLLGRLFGKMALKDMMKDKLIARNLPTVPGFKITENGDVDSEKNRWIALIKEHDNISKDGFVHPFFGKVTREQIGIMAYKHIDHHLRQFNS